MIAKLKAIGDPNRLRILHLLSYGELCVSGLQQVLGMSQSQVSRHLAYLRSAGLVTDHREGNQIFNKLVSSCNGTHKALIHLLECLFGQEEVFWKDLGALRGAIERGVCQIRQARLFPSPERDESDEFQFPAETAGQDDSQATDSKRWDEWR